MVDLWLMQPQKYINIALEEGFRKFTFHVVPQWASSLEIFTWMRANTQMYGRVKFMMIDHGGATEYETFSTWDEPVAVYPTWDPTDGWEMLDMLMASNVADDPSVTGAHAPPQLRPRPGQKHRVVVHRIPPAQDGRAEFMLKMREYQLKYPDAELFISGCTRFNDLFGLGLKAVDYLPVEITATGASQSRIVLPSGRQVAKDAIANPRYADWFNLIGVNQWDIVTKEDRILVCLLSARWAARNFDSVKPFVARKIRNGSNNTVFMPNEYMQVSDKDFILPATRRTVMRNLGIRPDEYDRFTCDTCILHNACTLYREGSVCTVKGSDAVGLADAFGSRDARVIMDGLTQLAKRNAERLENAMAAEEGSGELDPEVTKLTKTVFDQGVKLAKLRDPSLAGGAKVQVNVGVGAGGQANVGISTTNPKELTSTIVAELEQAGIPRDEIDGAMIKGVLRNMAQVGQQQAVSTAATKHQITSGKVIQGDTA